MSIQAVAAAIELRGIPTTPKLILMLLANAHNKHSEKCFPDQQRLADEASVDVKTVARHLKWLEDEGYILRHTTHRGRGKGSETHFELRFLQRTFCPVQEDRPLTGEIKTPHGQFRVDRNIGEQDRQLTSAKLPFKVPKNSTLPNY